MIGWLDVCVARRDVRVCVCVMGEGEGVRIEAVFRARIKVFGGPGVRGWRVCGGEGGKDTIPALRWSNVII